MRLAVARGLLLAATLATAPFIAPPAASAAPACVPSVLPLAALQQMADGLPLNGKKVGAGWDAVVLGTVTEVRHKSPQYRYRITMHVDSTLGADLPALYTFFGTSHGTFTFETGKVYAVPLARRTAPGPLLPTTELWVSPCDPVITVTDLPAAHEVIARTKPGYSPTPSPTPSSAPADAATPTADPTPEVAPPPPPAPPIARASFPDSNALRHAITLGIYAVGAAAVLIALVAAAESRWSHRYLS